MTSLIWWNLKRNYTNLKNTKRLTDLENELMVVSREGRRKGIARKFGMDLYTLLYLKWITHKDLLYSTGNCGQCYVAAWVGREFGGEWIHVYEWLRLLCSSETITTLLTGLSW